MVAASLIHLFFYLKDHKIEIKEKDQLSSSSIGVLKCNKNICLKKSPRQNDIKIEINAR